MKPYSLSDAICDCYYGRDSALLQEVRAKADTLEAALKEAKEVIRELEWMRDGLEK